MFFFKRINKSRRSNQIIILEHNLLERYVIVITKYTVYAVVVVVVAVLHLNIFPKKPYFKIEKLKIDSNL